MRLEEDDSGAEAPSRGADMYHCNGAGKLGLIIPPPSPSSYRRRGGAELRQRTHCTHAPSLRGHKNWGSRAMGGGAALTSLHWRLCIMFSSTLAINLVASAKFYFLSGGHLATDRTLKIVSSGCSTSRWPERRRARRLCSCGDQRTTRGGQMRGRARGVLAPTTNTSNTRCRCCSQLSFVSCANLLIWNLLYWPETSE